MTDFTALERSVYSQNGEDGVLEELFKVIEPGPKFAVDIGAGDGKEGSNTRNLLFNHGWKGLLVESDPAKAAEAHKNCTYLPVTLVNAQTHPGNVEAMLSQYEVPRDLDLVSIDIDGNDYYLWESLGFRPKVVVIEFNAGFPPPQRAVVEYAQFRAWEHDDYFGASIQSMCDLGKDLGYALVHCESVGANLFFVQDHYLPLLCIDDNSPEALYREPQYGSEVQGRAPNRRGYPVCDPSKKWIEG